MVVSSLYPPNRHFSEKWVCCLFGEEDSHANARGPSWWPRGCGSFSLFPKHLDIPSHLDLLSSDAHPQSDHGAGQ